MKKALLAALVLLPSLALGAGFAKQSIFLSKSSVTEGDTVLIHAVVQNDSTSAFPGTVVIADAETNVGSVPVELGAGEAQAVSVSWKPAAGSRTITAQLQSKDGAVVESESETFVIKEKPKSAVASAPAATSSAAAVVESSAGIQNQIDNLSPAVGGISAPIFKLVDSGRAALAGVLDSQLANIKPKLAPVPMPAVLGAQTQQDPELPNQQNWFWSIFYTVYFYILTVLRYLIGSAGIFYPLAAVLFLLILWKMFRRFRRA